MATYSSRLRLTLPATGEYTNSWGSVVNDGITTLLDDSISGTSAITIAGADYTLTSVNGSVDEARRMFIVATGTPGAARNVICPAVTKLYSITNSTTGGFALTLKTSGGTGISVPNGATMLLKCDGTNVVQAASTFADITYTTTLTGGTGIVNLGSGQFYKDASGNIGVGVTPTSYGAGYTTLAANGSAAGVLDLMSGGVSQFRLFSATASENRLQGVTNVPMTFYTNNTEKMRLDASGNLLVGTTSTDSTHKLQVAGRIGATGFANANGAYTALSASIQQGFPTFGFAFNLNVENAGANSYGVGILTTSAGVQAERLRIDASGNLLVGTTAANANLAKGVQIASTNWGSAVAVTASASVGTCAAWSRSTDGNVAQFYRDTSFTTLVGSISVTASATAYNTSSDKRLKTNIQDAPDAAALIDSIQVRSFDWLADGSHQRYGMVAQELRAVAPEAVHAPADPEAMMAVDYSKLVPMLVKEVQSLRARVAALEAA